jgi:predicted permease
MQIVVVILAFHVLAAVFWAGSSFVVARIEGVDARRVFGPQVGAAVVTILTGGYLWRTFHERAGGRAEHVLAIGIVAAVLALGFQTIAFLKLRAATRTGRIAALHFPAAGLLAIAVASMAVSRFM